MTASSHIRDLKIIGETIKDLRSKKNWSQSDLAAKLNTSQAAIARMEKGDQNLTTEMISKLTDIFHHKFLSLTPESIDFRIEGGRELSGETVTNTSKNGAMGLLCASLLNKGKTVLHGIPRIEEVYRIIEVLKSIGVQVTWIDIKSVEIIPPKVFDMDSINAVSARKTRTIVMFMGPLIHAMNSFKIPNSQGCKMGKRTVAAHIYGLNDLGVSIDVQEDAYVVTHSGLKPNQVLMYESGDTACENIMMAAALIPGKTTIKYATSNYMVQDVAFFLQALGVGVKGIGTTTIEIEGVESINQDIEFYNSEDPTESMMFLTAALVTRSSITIRRCPIDFIELELSKLEHMGFSFTYSDRYSSKNGRTVLIDITTHKPQQLHALDEKVYARPYPGINIDNLPFFVPIATMLEGTTLIHDWTWENRAIYFMELTRLGADMILADPHRVYVNGPSKLKAAQVVCPPALRPATIILMAMLGAEGVSILRNVYSIKRGYEDIALRLNQLGANIELLSGF